MYNYEEILAALRSGESAEEMLNHFADTVNAAQSELKKAAEKDAMAERQIEDTSYLLDVVKDYLNTYYPQVEVNEVSPAEFVELLDSMLNLSLTFKNKKLFDLDLDKLFRW